MLSSEDTSVRLQSGMRTHLTEDIYHGNKINKIELGRVSKVNYQTNSVGFILLTTGVNGSRASANKSYSAMLPMSMAGRNNYGKAYGEINPVRPGDIILVGFVDDKAFRPIVLGIYPDESIVNELTRNKQNDIDPVSVLDYALANSSYKVYPDQTYDFHDGKGTRALSFSGHSFLLINGDPITDGHLEHKTDDSSGALDYKDLTYSYFGNQELIEPVSDKAPEIILKHQGIVDGNDNPDTHALYLYIGTDGTYRVSQMKTDEAWRTYFEIKNSKIHLVRQKNSKIFGGLDTDALESSEIGINQDGSIILRNHTNGISIKPDGIYDLNGEQLITTKNAISDLILDKLGSLGFGGANLFSKSTATLNKFLDEYDNLSDSSGSLVSDYIECLGKNAYYTYAYAEKDVFDKDVTLSLVVYDSEKKYIEGKQVTGKANLQIMTRALPINASYLRVSISNSSVPIMLAYGLNYSAYQPSYIDVRATKNNIHDRNSQIKQDYLDMKDFSVSVLADKTLALQNINEILQDSILSTADKQLIKSYVTTAKNNYDSDIAKANKYEVNTDSYSLAYTQMLGRMQPIIADLTTSTAITASQIVDSWTNYYTERYNLVSRIFRGAEFLYSESLKKLTSAQIQQSNIMLQQFTNVTQGIEALTQTVNWTVVTDDIDLNNELVTENLLFKGERILNSAVVGDQYIQVFATNSFRSASTDTNINVTQKVWGTNSISSYSRILSNGSWSSWSLDAENHNYNEHLNNIDNSLSDLTSSNKDIQKQIKDNLLTVNDYQKSNDERVGKVEKRVTTNEGNISTLNGNVSTLQDTVSTNVTDIKNLKNKTTSLSGSISSLTDEVTKNSDLAKAATENIKTLQSKMQDLAERIAKLETRVGALESKSNT